MMALYDGHYMLKGGDGRVGVKGERMPVTVAMPVGRHQDTNNGNQVAKAILRSRPRLRLPLHRLPPAATSPPLLPTSTHPGCTWQPEAHTWG